MAMKRQIVTCREFDLGASNPRERDVFPLDDRWQLWGKTPLEAGQRVSIAVRRRGGKRFLISGVVAIETEACPCGTCDYVTRLVVVRPRVLASFLEEQLAKPSFEEWTSGRSSP